MSRKLIALLVSSALVAGSIGVPAQAASASMAQTRTAQIPAAKNESPLKPGGAAGIREAQGTGDLDIWFIGGLALAGIVAALLLADNDADSTGSTDAD